jgi:Iron-sulfur cluster-binding domain
MSEKNASPAVRLGVINQTPTDLYSESPCLIGYAYMRIELSGDARSCCIAKHPIGSLNEKSWREIWRSEAYGAFRAKMLKIQEEKFHLEDPEYAFCQQCSHVYTNLMFIKARNTNEA